MNIRCLGEQILGFTCSARILSFAGALDPGLGAFFFFLSPHMEGNFHCDQCDRIETALTQFTVAIIRTY